ncbi:MAG: PKD domain-containing protein [Bacteroidetes bacterium]|nr:MAG: PKD domain-containing protein [Bacteroidota bacterium]
MAIHPNPVVDFRKTDVCALDSAQFNNDSRIVKVLDDVISTWTWNWGDGSSSGSIPDPVHVYTRDGTYTVTLTARSDKGCETSLSKEVVIFPLPSTPDIQNDTVCFGDPALLIALPSANTSIIHWYYELSDPYSFQSSTVYNTDPVVYAQTYYVQPISEKGCWGTRVPIRASLFENGNFEIIPDRRVADIPEAAISFSANGSKGIDDYRWSFGDGGTSVLSDPVYNYLYPGIYEVILRLTDKDGCEEVLTDQVEIRELIVVHIPSAFSPNADGFNDEFFVQSQLISTFSFQVFNRWGQMLYETNSPDFRWNGQTPDGKSVKEGVYMYRMQATDIHGNPIEKAGTITVVL